MPGSKAAMIFTTRSRCSLEGPPSKSELHPEKTRTVDMKPPGSHVDFPGWHIKCSVGSRGWKKMNWNAICFWAAIVLLVDAAFGLWNHDRFAKMAPKINIRLIAFVEAGAAFALLTVHFLF